MIFESSTSEVFQHFDSVFMSLYQFLRILLAED